MVINRRKETPTFLVSLASLFVTVVVIMCMGTELMMVYGDNNNDDTMVDNNKDPPCGSVFFINYHKTGCALSKSVFKAINMNTEVLTTSNNDGKEFRHGEYPKRTGTCAIGDTSKGSFYRQTAPNYYCDLEFEPDTCIVHMVRDTFDHIISSFLYHTQDPTPEWWVNKHNPCDTYEYESTRMAEYQKRKIQARSTVKGWDDYGIDGSRERSYQKTLGIDHNKLQDVVSLCENLNEGSRTYYKQLKTLERNEALRLEATRFMISGSFWAGGDILRLPNNIVRLRESNARVLTLPMSSWFADIDKTIFDVLDFVFGDSMAKDVKQDIADDVKQDTKKAQGGQHVTTHIVSAKEKEEMKHVLNEDALLGPILRKMNQIITDEVSTN